jgi:hypothetical protein
MQAGALVYFVIISATSLQLKYAVCAAVMVLLLLRPPGILAGVSRALTARGVLPALPVIALAAADFVWYPYTRHVAHPSTGPDAMVVPMVRLLEGNQPYAAPLWDGALISPGPGWMLLNAPLSTNGLIVLLSPFWLALAAGLLASRDAVAGALFVGALFASRDFLVQSAGGHDIFAVNLAVTTVCLLAPHCMRNRARLIGLAILAGLVVTARVPLVLLVPVLGLGLARGDRRAGLVFTCVALVVAALFHAAFGAWAAWDGVFYQPLHVFLRAKSGAGPVFMLISAAGGAAACVAIYRLARPGPAALMLCCWLLEFGLFAPIGLGELVNVNHFDVTMWEGRHYIAWSLPLLCGYLALGAARRADHRVGLDRRLTDGRLPAVAGLWSD